MNKLLKYKNTRINKRNYFNIGTNSHYFNIIDHSYRIKSKYKVNNNCEKSRRIGKIEKTPKYFLHEVCI